MRRTLQFAAAALIFVPASVLAQHQGGGFGANRVPMHAANNAPVAGTRVGTVAPRVFVPNTSPRLGVRVTPRLTPQQHVAGGGFHTRSNGVRTNGGFNDANGVNIVPFGFSGETSFQNVPGLGFDYPHLAAISGNRHARPADFGGVFPFGSEGVFLTTPPLIVQEVVPVETQQAAVEDAPGDGETLGVVEPVRRPRSRRSQPVYDSEPPRAAAAATPVPEDNTEYVFVRRDGGLLFAVGYTWDKGTLRYVTRDGLRRSVSRDALDLSATEQFNEQRGLRFTAPA